MPRKALVIGCKGQDGTLLTGLLLGKDYQVTGIDVGLVRGSQGESFGQVDLAQPQQVARLVAGLLPDEIYYLAAYHHSSQDSAVASRELIDRSFAVNVQGLVNVLEAVRENSPATRIFYAASSLVFGNPAESPQTEETPVRPECVYGITKASGMQLCAFYRARHRVFASVGILYNHESRLRGENFLSQKIVRAAARIRAGSQKELVLGDLQARADWGYAPDYVEAMWRILQLDVPEVYIVATGQEHAVMDWVELAFGKAGLDWRSHVREDKALITRRKAALVGNSAKLHLHTGWKPATSFETMVERMLEG